MKTRACERRDDQYHLSQVVQIETNINRTGVSMSFSSRYPSYDIQTETNEFYTKRKKEKKRELNEEEKRIWAEDYAACKRTSMIGAESFLYFYRHPVK
ncbi:hypothetical protein V1477_002113 [Vespula maculifrons]|uniref:Uncharacterized protein n=1 Tax=Vespula maculifrons TaxID=7453 RepID=A0ABD2CY29_VESMC